MCHHFRIPHSQLLGGRAGRWSDDDVAKASAYMRHVERRASEGCQSCRTRPEDWVDLESGRPLTEPAFQIEVVDCEGCKAIAAVREQIRDEGDPTGRTPVLRLSRPEDFDPVLADLLEEQAAVEDASRLTGEQ